MKKKRLWWPVIALVATSAGAAEVCDQHLDSRPNDPYGYQMRGNRCEGRYIQEVGSITLLVSSLTADYRDFSVRSGQPLYLTWPAGAGGELHIRGQGLRHRFYYRMDAEADSASGRFAWPVDVLAAVGAGRADIGIVGWREISLGGRKREVYQPLWVGQGEPVRVGTGRSYRLLVRPGGEVEEIYLSVAQAPEGKPEGYIVDGKPLDLGYYPAGRPIEIALPKLTLPGIYSIEVGAQFRDGGTATVSFLLQHGG
jgi:hypothetical protein